MHDKMILLISFVVTDDSQDNEEDIHTGVNMDDTSAVHDGSDKSFVIVLSYKIAYHVQEITTVLVKKDCRWSVYDGLCKSFLMLLGWRNCI